MEPEIKLFVRESDRRYESRWVRATTVGSTNYPTLTSHTVYIYIESARNMPRYEFRKGSDYRLSLFRESGPREERRLVRRGESRQLVARA